MDMSTERKAYGYYWSITPFSLKNGTLNSEIGRYEKIQIGENPKPYKSDNILVHGLISCKN